MFVIFPPHPSIVNFDLNYAFDIVRLISLSFCCRWNLSILPLLLPRFLMIRILPSITFSRKGAKRLRKILLFFFLSFFFAKNFTEFLNRIKEATFFKKFQNLQ